MQLKSSNAVENFIWWHEKVFGHRPTSYHIPHRVLRNYLDAMQMVNREKDGLHNVTITISQNANIALLDTKALIECDITIRIKGVHYAR